MYCVKCGVKLADTENKCPLCGTVAYHPEIKRPNAEPLYPTTNPPKVSHRNAVNGATLIMFFIPMLITFIADVQTDGKVSWFGFVAGALILAYIILALPRWFRNPHPIIFTPCTFAATALYLLYINAVTDGDWFLTFALPITTVAAIIVCNAVTLVCCLKKGKLYVFGGTFMGLGAMMVLIELLIDVTFGVKFFGWSFYPFAVLFLFGCALIFLAINSSARESMERRFFL